MEVIFDHPRVMFKKSALLVLYFGSIHLLHWLVLALILQSLFCLWNNTMNKFETDDGYTYIGEAPMYLYVSCEAMLGIEED